MVKIININVKILVTPLTVCFNNKIFCIPMVFQNIDVSAVEETTCMLTLDSGICHYLTVLAKTEK